MSNETKLTLMKPVYATFAPLEDITAWELSKLLPFILNRAPFTETEWHWLGPMQRHFKRHD